MTVPSEEVEVVLREAGWFPGRQVSVEAWKTQFASRGVHMHHAAERFLTEFGGLTVEVHGPGVTCAREPFELNPSLCLGEEDRFAEWSAVVGSSIYPIGEMGDGRFFLGIDEASIVYLVADWIARYRPEVTTMESLVQGIAPEEISES
ncbi:hypothetical protein GO001_09935 [Streptomyces sp. NRRL B-1677]|uniref:SUKH-3 domain-containing protein n=1 Tax=Streptomyces TaxID=1883 RepID=UPI001892A6D9|nr:SUKH-3 domain-containing protein [Streptomyces sp. NRRL B-1677]MBF6045538.1 hypothetical protein [Streptomyces sp. NRRL B-1677]